MMRPLTTRAESELRLNVAFRVTFMLDGRLNSESKCELLLSIIAEARQKVHTVYCPTQIAVGVLRYVVASQHRTW
jgi:hypothetical protein